MTVPEIMARLESLGDKSMYATNLKNGAGENQFGVKKGDMRAIAKQLKLNPPLAAELWKTGNIDAQFLAVLLMKPKELSTDELEAMVKSATFNHLADWINSYVVKQHPEKEALRLKWMSSTDPALLRSAWSLTAERVAKDPTGIDITALLDRIEAEMLDAHELPKWTMNYCLAEIGINHLDHRARAIAIAEKLGVYRDYPTPKGCTSPFAPIWIDYFVSRQA
ncbi:MAG TPA: DNA alkylation repair protein [Fimbriimonas sp.]|nr:DNA alkylation repair protein [Fimbriimonas sp.]